MRYFDFHRRRLASKNHIIGTPSTVSGTDGVMLKATSGSKISKLEIGGNTYQYQEEASANRADPSYFSNSENYSSGGTAIYYIALPSYITEKEITFSLKEKSSLTGIKIAASDDTSPIFASAYSVILKNDGTTSTATGSTFKYLVVTRTVMDDDYSLPAWWESYDLQIELGSEATEYVPFTVPIATPSPENPSAVSNSNDNGTVITLQGKNLFDWSAVKSTQIVIEENGRKIIMPIRTESNSNGYTGTGATFRQLFPRLKAGDTATLSFNSNAEIKKIYISTVVVMWASGQTMTVTEDMLDCAVAFYGNYYAHGQTEQVIISDFQMELGTTATAYEPYFNKTVQIPSSVALPGGTSLEMRLAKIGNTADSLAVSRSQNKVIYNQNIGLLTFTGTENILLQSVNDYGFANFYVLLTSDISQGGLCNYFKSQSGSIANIKSEGFLLTSGTLYFRTNKYTTVEDFKTFLSGLYEGGNPLQFEYALKSPVEYDITDTDFAKELLSLETLRGCDLTLKAGADIAPSSIVCEYYSLENEDRQTVTVKCEKADGASLSEPCLHEVRKNTLYTVKAPEIDGYMSEKPYKSADASITTEIKFTYTEAEK